VSPHDGLKRTFVRGGQHTNQGAMKAIVVHEPGGPEVLQIEERPIPEPRAGWVLIQVKAFGLNRSEL
jgi:D-arabinose 1-dehydrogenase-like Zn-dependent alcohol dehydrogenase